MWSPAPVPVTVPILHESADQEGTCEYLASNKADVFGASSTTSDPSSPSKNDLPADLHEQLKHGAGIPFKFESPTGDLELDERRQRQRKANRESARRVRKRKTQESGMFETQVAEVEATNKRLLKRVEEVQGQRALATRVLRALHLKVAHLQGLNESLQVRVAVLQQQSAVQGGSRSLKTEVVSPKPDLKAADAAPCSAPSAADLLFSPSNKRTICEPSASPEAVHPKPNPASGTSPFADAAPVTSPSQAPWLTASGLHLTSQTAGMASTSGNAARADSMEAMLMSVDSEQSAARMQRMNSLTLAFTLSASLDSYPALQWQLPV